MTTTNEIKVTFIHPRSSVTYDAELDPGMTGNDAIGALIGEKFLDPETETVVYALSRKDNGASVTVPRDASFVSQGVKSGDTISVVVVSASAGA
ncbi:MAG: hypothetical protein ACHREM_07100 [Polyangiales bacterium]